MAAFGRNEKMLPYASQNLEWNRRARLHTCIPPSDACDFRPCVVVGVFLTACAALRSYGGLNSPAG